MKIISVVGARPEFIQAMPISQLLRNRHEEVLVHTGQHYDYQMSQRFFDELPIPRPAYNLAVGAGSHAQQTAEIICRMEQVLLTEKPDAVIVRGDTNSTLGAALGASKLQLPLIHIEAGERSFNKAMPEEINRLLVDAIADYHFCVSQKAVQQLAAEGKVSSVHWVGDVMLDALHQMLPAVATHRAPLDQLVVQPGHYGLLTIHRAANVEDAARLRKLLTTFNAIDEPIIFPAHPRTRQAIAALDFTVADHIRLIEPVGYLEMIMLAANARIIATDSGGLQREAFYLLTPCLTLRDETEWTETVTTGWNRLVGADPVAIQDAWQHFSPLAAPPPLLGDGTAARRIVEILEEALGK